MAIGDAVSKETAWLTTSGDGLPALLRTSGGPWDNIQSYWPRTPGRRPCTVYVLRTGLVERRLSNQRKLVTHDFHLRLVWPIGATTTAAQIAELEQQAFDNAIGLLVQRIRGTVGDKTHSGRFLSVAEAPEGDRIHVRFVPPETFLSSENELHADVTYSATDRDFVA